MNTTTPSKPSHSTLVSVLLLSLAALLLSVLTVHGVQRFFLGADHIMYSIMSLDEVTLFYWRQNRFLNLIPFLASPIQDPYSNLLVVLVLSAISHFICLALLAVFALRITRGNPVQLASATPTVLLLWGIWALLFDPKALATMLQHHEYSLSIALLLSSLLIFLRLGAFRTIRFWLLLAASLGLMTLALGVNPSTTLLAVLGVLLLIITSRNRQLMQLVIWLAFVAVTAFVWTNIMSQQGDEDRYFNILWGRTFEGAGLGFASFFEQFQLGWLLIIATFTLVGLTWIFTQSLRLANWQKLSNWRSLFAVMLTIGFAVAWIAAFSSIEWVFLNDHQARYYIPATYLLLVCISLAFAKVTERIFPRQIWLNAALACLMLLSLLVKAPLVFNLSSAPVFEELPKVRPAAKILAGDYWQVWPQYFALKFAGEEAVSVAYRSKAIGDEFKSRLTRMVDSGEPLVGWCMHAEFDRCERQVTSYLKNASLQDWQEVEAGVWQFKIELTG